MRTAQSLAFLCLLTLCALARAQGLPPLATDPFGAFHLLGTDRFGRDVWARLVYGARVSLGVGTLAVLLSMLWMMPWYSVWLLPLAAIIDDPRLRIGTLTFGAFVTLMYIP